MTSRRLRGFYTEARAASRLNHPNSVSIIDFGRTDDGILYLAMEFLVGKDLSLVMHEEGPLPFQRIADVLIGVLGALGEAHALGVIHRDLKPENIILRQLRNGADLVKVVDFGLATIVSGVGKTSITAPGLVCGTPDYMSPEQGKGESVDGRGDLYALGVVLYELLTDQLPFNDETPTKVVLRHINDPVPDPMEVAPHRGIPQGLADVAARALQKNASDRYRDAEEMAAALRAAIRPSAAPRAQIQCPACGSMNPSSMRFCGACGTRLAPEEVAATQPPITGVRTSLAPPRFRPLIGRESEMSHLESMRTDAANGPVWVHIRGESGAGKSRLLEELGRSAADDGDLVVVAPPHPSRAPVPYGPVRSLLASLAGVSPEALGTLLTDDDMLPDPVVRAGVEEVHDATGLVGTEGESRVAAVAAALSHLLDRATSAAASGRVVILMDDLPAADGLSKQVVASLSEISGASALIVTTGHSSAGSDRAQEMTVHGVGPDEARAFLAGGVSLSNGGVQGRSERSDPSRPANTHLRLPLYLEQIEAINSEDLDDDSLPPRLADAVAQRMDQLDVDARRLIQAIAVLGDRCQKAKLRQLIESEDLPGLETLREKYLVSIVGEEIEIVHPFLRDLVESSIPAEARRAFHERAFQLASADSEPLEVRAEHAFRAGEPMSALMILERMGDAALRRGDALTAVLAFRRALELGRRELLETGDQMLEGAILTFSRKLGDALARSGDITGSDGVLREALDLAGPSSVERARMLVSLGWVAVARDRRRDANRFLRQALEIVGHQRDDAGEAFVQLGIARVRRDEGEFAAAATALRRAVELQKEPASVPAPRRASTIIQLAAVLVDVEAFEEAGQLFEQAEQLAQRGEAVALEARAKGGRAEVFLRQGQNKDAQDTYRDAARLAAEAGDVVHRDRFREAANAL